MSTLPDFRNHPGLPEPSFPGSHIAMDDSYAFVSGLVASDLPGGDAAVGDLQEETGIVMRWGQRLLASAGCTLGNVVRVDVHLTDLDRIGDLDEVYGEYFEGNRYPARTCTESPRLCGGCMVEITLMARLPRNT